MRAILPGRPQSKRQAVCTAHWDGLRLVAYISGNTAIILRNPHEIVQTITVDHVENLSAITIDEISGRIAISNEERVLVYDAIGREENDLRWTQAHDITVPQGSTAHSISWGTSEELLVGGTELWLYHLPYSDAPRLIWQQALANEVCMAYFSNDSEFIASCGRYDRMVKVWRRLSFEVDTTRFDVTYLPHPAAVTNLHWRRSWHNEHSLDNLLYTFCSDDRVRVWTYSDPHSLSLAQLIATIDTSASIVPRRHSVGSISKKRYVFILDSRDFSIATENAIQQSQNQQVDHALEHLIEIANRSPELCVVFDGLGHMSVWGLENAGYKNKKPTVVFNIALVDQVDVQLSFQHDEENDYIALCAFGGGSGSASLSMLVHTYTGQIDWYESPITRFFDTSSRNDRVKLVSSWSGHDLAIDHIARGFRGDRILSWTDEGQAILWSQSHTGALRRQCEIDADRGVLSVVLFDIAGHLLVLHARAVSLWDVRRASAVQVTTISLGAKNAPASIRRIESFSRSTSSAFFILTYENGLQELWRAQLLANEIGSPHTNGKHIPLKKISQLEVELNRNLAYVPCDVTAVLKSQSTQSSGTVRTYVNNIGQIRSLITLPDLVSDEFAERNVLSFDTNIREPAFARACSSGKCAIVTQNRKSLTIWDTQYGVYEWSYEYSGADEIKKLAWTSTSRGNLFLFVGFSYHALVIGQFRFPSQATQQSAWYVTLNISMRNFTNVHIGDVCWLSSGDLAMGAGNQIFVLQNQVTEQDSPIIKRSQRLVSNQSASAVIDIANSALPIFHADFLEAIFLEVGLEPAEKILRSFYEKLKYFSEGDELPSYLDLPTEKLFFSRETNSRNGVYKVNGYVEDNTVELEKIEDSFVEYLEKSEIWQIGPKKRRDIASVFTNLVKIGKHRASLDDNALRYLYALYSTPEDQELEWRAYMFASRSSSHEALIDLVSQYHDGKLTWAVARRTGIFVWLKDPIALQTQFENVARMEYTKREERNPVDCSLYYLALNKKSVLQGLWRRTFGIREKDNTMKLLSNNFDEPRWKATALKNAYALLSKRRFEYGAAFFLLGSSLKDAVNVCVNQLHDVQLAIAIARVWDKDVQQGQQVLRELLHKNILQISTQTDQGRWMAAWAYSILDQPTHAIQALVRPLHEVVNLDLEDSNGPLKSMSFHANDPHLNIIYTQLRQTLLKQNKWTADVLSQKEEWDFVLRNASWWTRAGMDYLALRHLREWEFIAHQEPRKDIALTTLTARADVVARRESNAEELVTDQKVEAAKKKPAPTQFVEPSADSLLDSFGF